MDHNLYFCGQLFAGSITTAMKARADEEKPTVITYSGEIKLDVVVQEAIYNATCALQFKLEIMRNSNS